jgi:hypothetical protein
LLEVCSLSQIFAVDFRNRKPVLAKVPRELQECNILFTNSVEYPDRGLATAREPDNLAPRSPKFTLDGVYLLNRNVKVLFEEFAEDVHELYPSGILHKDITEADGKGCTAGPGATLE